MSSSTSRPSRIPMGPGGEFDLLRSLMGPEVEPGPGVLLGPGDDCTVLEGGIVVSTDQALEGIHFRREWITLEEAGYRATAAALSDLAAMAAEPVGALLSMALAPSLAEVEAKSLQTGAQKACEREGIQLLGGDLARSPGPLVLNVVAMGRTDSPVLRTGSEAGDEVWATGWLGGSGAAVAFWREGLSPPQELREAFARPKPRIREALWLKDRVPIHSLIDLSDGLAGDAGHLAAAGGVSLLLREEAIPIHPALVPKNGLAGAGERHSVPYSSTTAGSTLSPTAESAAAPLHFSLEGGEDFELCFTAPPGIVEKWVGLFQDSFGIPLTRLGRVTEGEGVFLETLSGKIGPLEQRGFNHFRGEEIG